MPHQETFDVCVIGTGAGGGVMIDRLTAAGLRVVALQRGPFLKPADFDDDELRTVWRGDAFSADRLETWRLSEENPAESGRFNSIAHCVGGTMVHWAGWSWRYRPDEFRILSVEGSVPGADLADWPISYDDLERHYERAEWEFGVSGDAAANPFGSPRKRAYPNPPHPDRQASLRFREAALKLGYHPFATPMAINSRPYQGRPGCMYGGTCSGFGCPIGAKGTTYAVSLPRALATRLLDLRPNALAFEITVGRDGKARSVRYIDQDTKAEREVSARHIVVAGNAIGTAHLLLMSTSGSFPHGLANSSGLVGRHLMFHSFTDVTFTAGEPTRAFAGLESHAAVDDLHASDSRRGFIRGAVVAEDNYTVKQPLLYGLSAAAGYAFAGRAWGPEYKAYLRAFPFSTDIVAIGEDLPVATNRIDLDPQVKDAYGLPVPRITHRQHPNDLAMNRWYAERLLEMADAAGAVKKWVSYGAMEDGASMKGSTHLHGTCRMGHDPGRSVVDRWCRSHDVPNLWVVDGSVFPTCAGYNPTLTILANAFRVAEHFIEEWGRGNA